MAAHYLAFLRDGNGPSLPGGLMQIVSSMAVRRSLDRRVAGDSKDEYAVGFLSAIDAILQLWVKQVVLIPEAEETVS
jgi:hypothetical protein